ncbi:hypothetical protein GKC56_05685 [Neisseriaceae bacterium PsAf]|nr:hypothetical protein [Neisseriaceae bacterium PsAf]
MSNNENEMINKLMKQSILFGKQTQQALDELQELRRELQQLPSTVEKQAKNTIYNVTKDSYQRFEESSNTMINKIDHSGMRFVQATQYVDNRMKKYQLWGIGSSIIIALLIIALPSLYIYSKKQEIRAIHHTAEVHKAMQQYHFNLCGDKLCIKVDRNDPIWKNDKDYLIVKQ